jgi:hypothetical protein
MSKNEEFNTVNKLALRLIKLQVRNNAQEEENFSKLDEICSRDLIEGL